MRTRLMKLKVDDVRLTFKSSCGWMCTNRSFDSEFWNIEIYNKIGFIFK